jgi:hypothetical protein
LQRELENVTMGYGEETKILHLKGTYIYVIFSGPPKGKGNAHHVTAVSASKIQTAISVAVHVRV